MVVVPPILFKLHENTEVVNRNKYVVVKIHSFILNGSTALCWVLVSSSVS
jgi:hypothetical protein